MGSQAWSKCDVTWLYAKNELKVKSNTSMNQAIIIEVDGRMIRNVSFGVTVATDKVENIDEPLLVQFVVVFFLLLHISEPGKDRCTVSMKDGI